MNVQCPSCATVYRVDPAKVPDEGTRARCTMCATTITVRLDASPAMTWAPEAAPAVAPPEPAPPPRIERPPFPAAAPPDRAPEAPAPAQPPPVRPRAAPVAPKPAAPAPGARRRVTQPFFQQRGAPGVHSTSPTEPPAVESPKARPSAPVFRPTPGQPVTPASDASAPVSAPSPRRTPPGQPSGDTASPAPTGAPPPAAAAPAAPAAAEKKHVNPFLARDPRQKARRLARALVSDMIVYQPEKRQQALAQGNLKHAFEDEILKSWHEYVEQVGEEIANSTPYWNDALNEILAGGQRVF